MYKYTVWFEGTTEVHSEEPLTEEQVFDEADSIILSDARTRLDHDCSVCNMELTNTEETNE